MEKRERLELITIGRSSVDLYGIQVGGRLEDMRSFEKYIGGSPTNIAVGASRLGLQSAVITRVGKEHMGRFIKEQLQKEGVNTRGVVTDSERLTALVILGIRDQNTFPLIFYREDCADMALSEADICEEFISDANCVCVTGTHLSNPRVERATLKAIHIGRRLGKKTVLDIDYRPYTWESEDKAKQIYNLAAENCCGIIGNDDEFAVLSGSYEDGLDYAKKLSLDCDLIIYKMGEKGSITYANNKEIIKGIFPVKPLKPTGAGDAFMGALIGALLKNYDIEKAIEIGSAAAAIVVTKVGCAPAMPSLNEILEFMKTNTIN